MDKGLLHALLDDLTSTDKVTVTPPVNPDYIAKWGAWEGRGHSVEEAKEALIKTLTTGLRRTK